MALDDGHDNREVSEWLGHADYATTLRVYAHWIPDTRENTMSAPPVPAPGGNVARYGGTWADLLAPPTRAPARLLGR